MTGARARQSRSRLRRCACMEGSRAEPDRTRPGTSTSVTRSRARLQACETLLVWTPRRIEAQTLANAYLAIEKHLEIVPVLNKIDLPQADPEAPRSRFASSRGAPSKCWRSRPRPGRSRAGARRRDRAIPAPTGDLDAPARALVFDSPTTSTAACGLRAHDRRLVSRRQALKRWRSHRVRARGDRFFALG